MPSEKELKNDFEAGSEAYDIELQPLVSIAISLKRIADAWGKENPKAAKSEDTF